MLARPDFAGVTCGEAPDGGPHLAYRLHTEDGRTIRYRYYGEAETDKPVQFYRSDQPWTYRAPSKQLAAIDALTPKTLIASDDGSAGSATKPDAPTPADTAPSSAEMATAPPS